MSLLIESLCCVDGEIKNIHYHTVRMNKSRYDLFGCNDTLTISDYITVPDYATQGIWKIRVYYNATVKKIEYELYKRKSISTVTIIVDDTIDYPYKYADRSRITQLFEQRGNADDILIIKRGLVTDSSSANVALYDGSMWFTPKTPLLAGTKRAKLIDEGKIKEAYITVNDISAFTHISLINAFLDLGDIIIPVSSINNLCTIHSK
ncbi:MAG: aminotransferase class IV [Spirochaetes bacterium]|nr:aminotransferase class IV [Spirochaetota bacterium]